MREIGVGLVGSGFIADFHAESFGYVPDAAVLAVASPTNDHARRFAEKHSIGRWHSDYRALLDEDDIDLVCVGVPNDLHRDVVVAAAEAVSRA